MHQLRSPRLVAALAAVALAAAACGSTTPTAAPSTASDAPSTAASVPASAPASEAASPSGGAEPVELTVGLGYIPSVQFAQFYLAKQAGYYADAGLDVTLQNDIDPNLITLIGQGAIDIGSGDGTSVIPAVSQGIPVIYAATIYGRFPSVLIARKESGIATAADLKGKTIGIPGRYGSSWIMLQALLQSANLTPEDVRIQEFPDFGQAAALQQGTVDAATGFANNEPIQLGNAGIATTVLTVDDVVPLPGPGLVTGTKTAAEKTAALQRFVAATLRAMEEIRANPQAGLDATFAVVPDLATDAALQRQILDATVAQWTSPRTSGYGAIDRDGWAQSLSFMTKLGLVPNQVSVDQLVTEDLLP